MILLTVAAFLPSLLIGFLLCILLLDTTIFDALALKACLAIGMGLGFSAILYFWFSLISNPSDSRFIIVEFIILFVLVAIVTGRFLRKKSESYNLWTTIKNSSPLEWSLLLVFLALAALMLLCFNWLSDLNPHGRYDAWAIWNFRARFLSRGGPYWLDAFSPLVFHADYPLMVPENIAQAWQLLGSETQKVPIFVAGLYTFGLAALLVSGLYILKGRSPAMIAGIVLLSTPWIVYFGSLQFADIPLAIYILSTCILLYIQEHRPGPVFGKRILAGLMTGFAGWTKNEGQLFLAVVVFFFCIYALCQPTWKNRLNALLAFSIGLALPLSAVLYFKVFLAPPNDVINSTGLGQILEKMTSPLRYQQVYQALVAFPKQFGGWRIPMALGLLAYAILLRPAISMKSRGVTMLLAGILIVQLLGYLGIYLVTPLNLEKHINQSFDRLLIHLYPAFLFLFFNVVRSPEEALATGKWLELKRGKTG